MTFSEVRQYQQGDDIRLIDWNVTARSGEPFIKVFEEEGANCNFSCGYIRIRSFWFSIS